MRSALRTLAIACQRLRGDSAGTVAVEMAFAVPVLITLVVGVTELGRAVHYHQAATDGARAALRYLSRVGDPCTGAALDAAVGLAVTRSVDWENPPQFADWPTEDEWPASAETLAASPYENGIDDNFEVVLTGCGGTGPSEYMTLLVRYRYRDTLGILDFIGLEGGFWVAARHQERFLGL